MSLNVENLFVKCGDSTKVAELSVVRGQVLESKFSEEDGDPLATVRGMLEKYKVPFDATLFREAVRKTSEGWSVKLKKVNPT